MGMFDSSPSHDLSKPSMDVPTPALSGNASNTKEQHPRTAPPLFTFVQSDF